MKVVAQQYEDQVRREVLGDALQKSFGDAIPEQNLKVAGYPRFEPKSDCDRRSGGRIQRDVRDLSRSENRRYQQCRDQSPGHERE